MKKIKAILVGIVMLAATMFVVGGSATSADAKDPCFVSDGEFGHWNREVPTSGGGALPGWGDSAARVDKLLGCTGTWAPASPIWRCFAAAAPISFRVYPQANGKQVAILFKTSAVTADVARCTAGHFGTGGVYHQEFRQP